MKQTVFILTILMLTSSLAAAQNDSTRDTITDQSSRQVGDSITGDSVVQAIDSLELIYGVELYDTLPDLAAEVFEALRTRKFKDLERFIATAEMIKVEFDTLDTEYLNRLAGVKYQYMFNKLRKNHLKMVKYAKYYHLNLRMMELVKYRYREKINPDGHEYGEVTYLCKYGRHTFYISFIALKIIDRWFLADELTIEEILDPQDSGRR